MGIPTQRRTTSRIFAARFRRTLRIFRRTSAASEGGARDDNALWAPGLMKGREGTQERPLPMRLTARCWYRESALAHQGVDAGVLAAEGAVRVGGVHGVAHR